MYQLINLTQFRTAFATHFGGQYAKNFTSKGLEVLFNHLESHKEEPTDIELDVVAFCCEFAEYTWDEVRGMIDDGFDCNVEELHARLEELTIVCGTTDTTIVVQHF